MSRNLVLTIGLAVAAVLAVVGAVTLSGSGEPAPPGTDPSARAVRPDSHRLSTAPDGRVTFVEFRTVADPATLARIRADREDGMALGVTGTPTFFVNGTRLQPDDVNDLRAAIDSALTDGG